MKQLLRQWRYVAAVLSVAFFFAGFGTPVPTLAATTGTISGTVSDAQSGAPVANVTVTAASPSGTRQTVSDSRGFYTVQALVPDTYTVSFQAKGYAAISVPGITVQQGMTAALDQKLSKELKTIASAVARGASNLVKPNQPADVYTVSGQQLNAISGGDNLHKTLYQYIQAVPGVTSSGFPAQPRIHGQSITDVGYEFDGIPIKDRITGFFTTNLSNVGIANVEVYTGGLSAGDAASGAGIINSVIKTGTYPGFAVASFGLTAPDYNHYTTLEFGGATPNRRYSYYVAFDGVGSQNSYDGGTHTYPNVLIGGYNGPGTVKTRDIVGNFHYRPNNNDDFQFLIQNGVGEFDYNYLLNRTPGQPYALALTPCPGYTTGSTATGATGGTAPNGQPCPVGLYFSALGNGQGNLWHHYSGIGKLQWNHIINDHSMFALRFAENFNQYIFDQPLAEYNAPWLGEPSQPLAGCPTLPYAANTPVQVNGKGSPCFYEWNNFSLAFEGDRRSNMWLGALDYTNDVNANLTLHAGIGNELDQNVYSYYYTSYFNGNGSWPGDYVISNYPTRIPYIYGSASIKAGRFLLEPGLRYQRMVYDIPASAGGPTSVGMWTPTFAGTYTLDPSNVLRFSYTDSSSFVGSGYVYRETQTSTYNPTLPNFSFAPTRLHSADLMWEHQIDRSTSIKFGPWMNKADNVFFLYKPCLTNCDGNGIPTFGPSTPSNGAVRKAAGFELGLNHVDTHPVGISYWLSGTYDNYWTSVTSSLTASYNVSNLPQTILNGGTLIRSSSNPLFSGSLTADIHVNRFSLLPLVYYQTGTFFNTGVTSQCTTWITTSKTTCANHAGTYVAPFIAQPEQIAHGYWKTNLTGLERLGPNQDWVVGVSVTNLFNNVTDVAPCNSDGTGCYPFDGPFSGVNTAVGSSTHPVYIYQNYSQDPRRFEFFLTKKF